MTSPGRWLRTTMHSPAREGNALGDPADRPVEVHLPPATTTARTPMSRRRVSVHSAFPDAAHATISSRYPQSLAWLASVPGPAVPVPPAAAR